MFPKKKLYNIFVEMLEADNPGNDVDCRSLLCEFKRVYLKCKPEADTERNNSERHFDYLRHLFPLEKALRNSDYRNGVHELTTLYHYEGGNIFYRRLRDNLIFLFDKYIKEGNGKCEN